MGRDIVVLVDRSRDGVSAAPLGGLTQHCGFRVIENERRLSAAALRGVDVLVAQTCGASRYGAGELRAIRQFVRSGGGLLLSASAGAFETDSGQSVDRSAAQQVAGLFGAALISSREARDATEMDGALVAGYRRRDLAFTPVGVFAGVTGDGVQAGRSAPLALRRGAQVVLRHVRTGEPVAAVVRCGRGRVLIANVRGFGMASDIDAALVAERLAGRRAGRAPRPVRPRVARWTVLRRAELRFRCRDVAAGRAKEIADLAVDVLTRLKKRFGPKVRASLWIDIAPGAGCVYEWSWRHWTHVVRVGSDTTREPLIYGLAFALALRLLWADERLYVLWRTIGPDTLASHLALDVLDSYGMSAQASSRRAVLESWPDGEGDVDPRRVDLGRWRAEAGSSPALWMWRALESDMGKGFIDRFLRAGAKAKDADKTPPVGLVNEFDLLAHWLSMSAGRDLSAWFAGRGTTVRPVPAVSAANKEFPALWRRMMERRLRDARLNVSERMDAVRALVWLSGKAGTRPAREAARLRSRDESERLVAAARLAARRDERGAAALRRIAAGSRDKGCAAIAACLLAELGDRRIAARLMKMASGADARFRMDARAAGGEDRPPRPAMSIEARREDLLKHLGKVDGYVVGNVFSRMMWQRWPGGLAVPEQLIVWVHASPDWRRKGVSRALLTAALNDEWARAVPISTLNTGVRNLAHTLYREMGFVDLAVRETWSRRAEADADAPTVRGVRVREATERDAARMAALFEEVYEGFYGLRGRRVPRVPSADSFAVVAERGRRLIGYLSGSVPAPDGGKEVEGRLVEACLRPGKDAEAVMRAAAARFTRVAARRGATGLMSWSMPEDDAVRRGLMAAGFVRAIPGGVEMWRLNDLPGLLDAIRPLLERRLRVAKRGDWTGTVAVCGTKHRAALRVEHGRVAVLRDVPARADVAVEMDDAAITRMMAGRQTAFEAMLQSEARVRPRLNEETTGLLEALFPRMKLYLWNWW